MSLLVLDQVHPNTCEGIEFVQLPHPGHAPTLATFGFIKGAEGEKLTLCELHRAENEHASFFVENAVHRNGVVYLCTACDPNFLLLALLSQETVGERWVPLTQLVYVPEFPRYARVLDCARANVELLADYKQDEGLVRINPEKVMTYLSARANAVERELVKTHTLAWAQRQTFQMSTNSAAATHALPPSMAKECQRLSLQMVCDYVPGKWKEALANNASGWTLKQILASSASAAAAPNQQTEEAQPSWEEANGYAVATSSSNTSNQLRFGIKPADLTSATAPGSSSSSSSKRLKPSAPAPLTAAQKRANKGAQPLSSFFSKKQ